MKKMLYSSPRSWVSNFGKDNLEDEYHEALREIDKLKSKLEGCKNLLGDLEVSLKCVTSYEDDMKLLSRFQHLLED